MNRGIIATCFAVSAISIAVASGTITPVAYGVGEATPGVTGTGIVSILTALISGAGGLFALLKSSPLVTDFAKNTLNDLSTKNISGVALDAAFLTIAAAVFSRKGSLDVTLITSLAELRKKIEEVPVPK